MIHGTHSGYGSGCRCQCCKEGERVYQRAYRRVQRVRDRSEVPFDDECPRCGRIIASGQNMKRHIRAHERRNNELIPSGQTQLVTAEQLRAGDLLACGFVEPLKVEAVKVLSRSVRVTTHNKVWRARKSTRFVRHLIGRRSDVDIAKPKERA